MNIRTKKINNKLKKSIIIRHIGNNIKAYFLTAFLVIIGIIIGVISMNHNTQLQKEETNTYINSFIETIKEGKSLNEFQILKESIQKNFSITFIMWFISLTLIGSIFIYGIMLISGFCIGYTISSVMYTLGIGKGLLFIFTSLFLQNIIYIPALIVFAIYCIKQSELLLKNNKKNDIKVSLIKHTIISIIAFLIFIISSIIESYVSKNILLFFIKYL